MEPHQLGLSEAARAIRGGDLSATELARSLIQRHEAVEPLVKAMAHFDPEALLVRAREVDERLGDLEPVGPLAGVPVGIKDIFDCSGVPTGAGVRERPGWVPRRTSPAIAPLFEAGAILHGKTATTDRAFLDPTDTANPWNLAHTPGGSSSGSAAGVAARLFPAAIGTQTAGSVIRPAAFCGVVGMTLTRGRVPLDRGVVPLVPRFDTAGFFVRSVDDAELLLATWCGDDGHGPTPQEIPQESFERPVFLGFARRGFIERSDDEAAHHAIHTGKSLSDGGAIVHVMKVPESYDVAMSMHRKIFAFEASQVHRLDYQRDPESFQPHIAGLIEEGLRVTTGQYHRALETLDHFREDMLARISEVDAIILPAATGPAPLGLDSTGDPRCNAAWTAIGFPAITLPSGFSEDGLPLGLQIVGKPTGEGLLLRVARFCEQVLEFSREEPSGLRGRN